MAVEITPRGAYFARRCPERVQLDVLWPCEPLPDSPHLRQLAQAGREYEVTTFEALVAGVDGAFVVAAEEPEVQERLTVAALADGVPVVAGGRLPVDQVGHRVGEPDLLVRDGHPGSSSVRGYLPVDVKSHMALRQAGTPASGSARVSELAAPWFGVAVTDPGHDARKHVGDLLQLAHYRRLLERAGVASPAHNVGGILGSEGVVVWYDLDQRWLEASEYLESAPAGPLSAMELYELEFAHRLAVYRAAKSHAEVAAAPLLAEPIDVDECRRCRWRAWCGPVLEGTADLSLISGVGPARRRLYQAHGVGDLHALGALDWTTAELVRCGVDLTDLLDRAQELPPATPLATVIPNRAAQRERLAAQGLQTVADTDAIDRRTLDLCSAGVSNLATQIDLARARVGPAPAYRRRGVDRVHVSRGDVEVDVDMENAEGCYLWGALVTDRRRSPPTSRYVPFATWDPDLDRGELVAFSGFWGWLAGERARARADGATFRAYCYSKSAEEGQMKRIADRLERRGEVDELLSSDDWVDLHHVVRTQLVTGRSMGLKQTAPLAGFSWRSEDVGGDLALVHYGHAVDDSDPDGQEEARRWILEYNEDDVRATAALRQWLDTEANELPSIADAPRSAAAEPDRGSRRRPSWYGR